MTATKLHNFEQVKDVLDYGIQLHAELSGLYGRLSDQSEQERVKMLLDYLMRHERNRQVAMERFEEGAKPGVLNLWLQYSPSSNIEQMISACPMNAAMSVDDVVRLGMAFDDALIALYREVAEEVDSPEVKDLCLSLADMQEQERHRFVRDVEWAQDM